MRLSSAYPTLPLKEQQALTKSDKPIAKNALTILINISTDPDVLGLLAEDDAFLETLLVRVTVCQLAPPFYTLKPPPLSLG